MDFNLFPIKIKNLIIDFLDVYSLLPIRSVNKLFNDKFNYKRNIYNIEFLNYINNFTCFIVSNTNDIYGVYLKYCTQFRKILEDVMYDEILRSDTKSLIKNLLIKQQQIYSKIIFSKSNFYTFLQNFNITINLYYEPKFGYEMMNNLYIPYPDIYIGSVKKFINTLELTYTDLLNINLSEYDVIIIFRDFSQYFADLLFNKQFRVINSYETYIEIISSIFNNNMIFTLNPLDKMTYTLNDLPKNYYITNFS